MSERITQPPTYYTVFAALIGLTLFTVGISFLELGQWHTVVGLVIAAAKALLVVLYFMHLLYSTRLNRLMLGAGLFWLAILVTLTLTDYLKRQWMTY